MAVVIEGTKRVWDRIVELCSSDPDVLFDAGPGFPNMEAWFCKKTYPDCKIIGAEANYRRFQTLEKAGYPGTLMHKAVGATCDVAEGYMDRANRFFLYSCSEARKESGVCRKKEIPSVTLDELNKTMGPFKNAIIWADIEGFEYDALRGSKDLLENKIPMVVYVEVLPGFQEMLGKMQKFMSKYDYEYIGLVGDRNPLDHLFIRNENEVT